MPEVEMFMVGKSPRQRGRTKVGGSIFRKMESGTITFQGQVLAFVLMAVNCTIKNDQAYEEMKKLGYRCPTPEEYIAVKKCHRKLIKPGSSCYSSAPEAEWQMETIFLMIKK